MPGLLRTATLANVLLGILIPVFAILAGLGYGEETLAFRWHTLDEPLAGPDVWRTGVGFAAFTTAAIMFAVGIAIVRRAPWSRTALVIEPVLQVLPFEVVHRLLGAPDPHFWSPDFAVPCGVWAALTAGYLFGFRSAREYFARRPAAGPPVAGK
jgi:hypothetical protein